MDSFTAEILAEMMKQASDMLAKIMAERGGIDRINSIAKGELTFMDSEANINNIRTYFINRDHQ